MVNHNPRPSGDDLQRLESDIAAQYELEKWWVEEAKARDLEYGELLRESGRVTTDKGIRALLTKMAERLALEIEDRAFNSAGKHYRRDFKILERLLRDIQPFELAYLVLAMAATIALTSTKGSVSLAGLVSALAEAVEHELRFRAMVKLEPELPRIVESVLKDSRASVKHRRKVFINLFHKKSGLRIPGVFPNNDTKIEVGKALASLVFLAPQIASVEKIYDVKKRDLVWMVKPSDMLKDLFYRELDLGWLAHRTAPFGILLYAPSERSAKDESPEMLLTREVPIIKINKLGGKLQGNIDILMQNDHGYSTLLRVISYLEQVPMKVNTRMLQYVQENRDLLLSIGALHSAVLAIPDCPIAKDQKDLSAEELRKLKEWKKHSEKLHNKYHKDRVRVYKEMRVLELAEKLSRYPQFYYRWHADFRGRLYTVNTLLSFQSNPLSKSLLEFASPGLVVVGNPSDHGWYDLVECGLRLLPQFSKAPIEEIEPYLGDKAKLAKVVEEFKEADPAAFFARIGRKHYLPFVAWVLEMERLLPHWGEQMHSGLPVKKDATCSSMQHMAALSGDMNVLTATNCNGSATVPQDLYTTVVPNYKELGLERDWIKQFVMTYAYLATDYTRKDELQNSFEEMYGLPMSRAKAIELNDEMKKAAHKGLGKVTKLQECLMEVYRHLVCKEGRDALSVTPTQFVVDSTKYDFPSRQYELYHLSARVRVRMKILEPDELKIDKRKTRSSWVANIIHSMDAALLHIVLNCFSNLREGKLHIATIHDCVVTRPGDMFSTTKALGFAFKYMYSPNRESGMAEALHQLVEFWDLENDCPDLYKRFVREFKGVKPSTFDEMRYFFI